MAKSFNVFLFWRLYEADIYKLPASASAEGERIQLFRVRMRAELFSWCGTQPPGAFTAMPDLLPA
eukprot:14666417-Alexandrium_andersonii.AAC.1